MPVSIVLADVVPPPQLQAAVQTIMNNKELRTMRPAAPEASQPKQVPTSSFAQPQVSSSARSEQMKILPNNTSQPSSLPIPSTPITSNGAISSVGATSTVAPMPPSPAN